MLEDGNMNSMKPLISHVDCSIYNVGNEAYERLFAHQK